MMPPKNLLPPCDTLPPQRELHDALYRGQLFSAPANDTSLGLVERVRHRLEQTFADVAPPREAQGLMDPAEFFRRVGELRREFYLGDDYQRALTGLLRSFGLEPRDYAVDPLRLRVVASGGHRDPRAAPVYYGHRDTWYGHSQALITWWIPLDDLPPEQTFVFYPERFAEEVSNDSEIFDYDAWVKRGWGLKIGWQDREAGRTARYPGVVGEVDAGEALGFGVQRAANLLFAGAHYHRTLPQDSGETRFSLDFRLVHLGDHDRGLGAPNVDNRSRGCALVDFVRLEELCP